MKENNDGKTITPQLKNSFIAYLIEQEKSASTIELYRRCILRLSRFLSGRAVSKSLLLEWKQALIELYKPASVNTMLAGTNCFLGFAGWQEYKLKPLKIQRSLFCEDEKELSRQEYIRLIQAAQKTGNQRLCLVIQTICATGIRVSELEFITAEAVRTGRTEVKCKGKTRSIFLPKKLRHALSGYARANKINKGPIFITSMGRPLNRSNIWRDMKALCGSAGVSPEKVFPHNLRHLFARTYYALEKDLFRLADILGHSDVNTTRIYAVESGKTHARQIEKMGLAVT